MTAWKSLKVALFGYAMNDMGDIRVDESALVRSLGPEILAVAPGELYREMQAVTDAQVADVVGMNREPCRAVSVGVWRDRGGAMAASNPLRSRM